MTADLVIPLVLQVIGVGVLVAEVILPSGGLLTILTVGIFGYSLYLVFTVSVFAGMIFVMADIIILPTVLIVGFKFMAHSRITLRTELSRSAGYATYDEKLTGLAGKEGTAVTDLRPAGTAMIENKRVDVVTRGDYIEKGADIRVSTVEGGRVVVRRIDPDRNPS